MLRITEMVSSEELLERLKQIAKQQKGKHTGGNRWIGNGGMSPFGSNGAALGGLRMSGGGGGKMAPGGHRRYAILSC